jgi:hypothetical protein
MALDEGKLENRNTNQYIEPIIRRICTAKMQPPEMRNEAQKDDVEHFKLHKDSPFARTREYTPRDIGEHSLRIPH